MTICGATNTITEDDLSVTYECTFEVGHAGPHADGEGWMWHRLELASTVAKGEREAS